MEGDRQLFPPLHTYPLDNKIFILIALIYDFTKMVMTKMFSWPIKMVKPFKTSKLIGTFFHENVYIFHVHFFLYLPRLALTRQDILLLIGYNSF